MGRSFSGVRKAWLFSAALAVGFTTAPVRAENVRIPMHGFGAGTFYVQVEVARLGSMDFLVDTGSGYTAIGAGLLAAMQQTGDAVFVKPLEGVMADGSRHIVPVYRISEIRLGACVLKDVEAAVFDEGTRPILGMRALTRVAPFTFSTSPPGISLSRCDAVATAEGPVEAAAPASSAGDVLSDAG